MNTQPYIAFIQSITPDEIKFISERDYGMDSARHAEALRQLIFDQNGLIRQDQFWYPYEVVELGRWVCEAGHEREFMFCNIIICLSLIAGADQNNDPEYMREVLQNEFPKLQESDRKFVVHILEEAIASFG